MVKTVKPAVRWMSVTSMGSWDGKCEVIQLSYRARQVRYGNSPFILMFVVDCCFPKSAGQLEKAVGNEDHARASENTGSVERQMTSMMAAEGYRTSRFSPAEPLQVQGIKVGDIIAIRKVGWEGATLLVLVGMVHFR